MRPDGLRPRDLRLGSQPPEDQPHRDPRPATRSPESHDPKEAEDRGANRERQVTTQPEFRRGPRGKSPGGLKSRGKERKALSHGRLADNRGCTSEQLPFKKENWMQEGIWVSKACLRSSLELLGQMLATCLKCLRLLEAWTFGKDSAEVPHQTKEYIFDTKSIVRGSL